ncbi:MAG: TonB-dependent receptor [bacterium]
MLNIKLSVFGFMLCVLLSSVVYATVPITGRVVIKDSSIPIKGALVRMGDQTRYSDANGHFSLISPSSNTHIEISANGYATKHWNSQALKQALESGYFPLAIKTVIKAGKQQVIANRDQEKISYYYVDDKVIQRLSEGSLFSDTMSALKMLPGVASKSSFDAKMYIRGGSAYEIVGVLDDVPIMQPYHWGGRVSIFNAKIAKHVDFYPGGYDARGGQSLSGIIDVYTKDGDFDQKQQELDINMTELNYYGTFPITKKQTTSMVSYRRTYYDLFAPLFIKSDSGSVNMPYLQSFQGKLTHKLDDSHSVRLALYGFQDGANTPLDVFSDTDEKGKFIYDSGKYIVSTKVDSTLSPTLFNEALVAYYQNKGTFALTNKNDVDVSWHERNVILRDDLTWKGHEQHTIEAGTILYVTKATNTSSWIQSPNPKEPGSVTQNVKTSIDIPILISSLYLQDHWAFTPDLTLMTGLRLDVVRLDNYALQYDWQPRISLEYMLNDRSKIKGYYGRYAQQNYQINSLFSSSGSTLEGRIADTVMEKAQHYGIGIEHYLSPSTLFKSELFYKHYDDLGINVARYPEERYENQGFGHAHGLELMLQKVSGKRFEGWGTYTWSSTRRKDTQHGWFYPDYDIRHMLNLYGDYKVNKTLTVISNVKLSTGSPYTPILSASNNPQTGALEYQLGDYLSKRLPTYFRVDLWFETPGVRLFLPIPFLPISSHMKWGIFPYWELKGKTRLGLFNVLNRKNPSDYRWNKKKNKATFINDFPFMFIFGYKIIF